jgi:RNA polymerase sigma-70 factor (ECF subfamily)
MTTRSEPGATARALNAGEPRPADAAGGGEARIRALVAAHLPFVWRYLRRFGLGRADADDVTQLVFVTAARRIHEIEPERERAFLLGTALRAAANHRRDQRRQRVDETATLVEPPDVRPDPEELVALLEGRRMLDEILARLSDEHRSVFILYEMEQLTAVEISSLLGIPTRTAESRVRRARAAFWKAVERIHSGGRRQMDAE